MYAAVLFAAAVIPVEAPRPGGATCLIAHGRVCLGRMPVSDGEPEGLLLSRPLLRFNGFGPVTISCGQQQPSFRDEAGWRFPYRTQRVVMTAEPSGAGQAEVEVTLYRSEVASDTPDPGALRAGPYGEPAARFAGTVPLGRPFRVGGGGVWAEFVLGAESEAARRGRKVEPTDTRSGSHTLPPEPRRN